MEIKFPVHKTSQGDQSSRQRQTVPPGSHVLQIVAAEWGPNDRKKNASNPDGMCLSLRLRLDADHLFVFDDIGLHEQNKFSQLASAVGLVNDGDTWTASVEDFLRRSVIAEICNFTTKTGNLKAAVDRYVGAADSASGADASDEFPARGKHGKQAPGSDDIPF